VRPGDWIVAINENALCNVVFPRTNDVPNAAKCTKAKCTMREDALIEQVVMLLAQAPDKFSLVVERNPVELTFDLQRGPVAPALLEALEKNTPAYIRELAAQKIEADKLVAELDAEPANWTEITRRNDRIEERLAAYRKFIDGVRELLALHQVPREVQEQ
jgi:hypothetical protein